MNRPSFCEAPNRVARQRPPLRTSLVLAALLLTPAPRAGAQSCTYPAWCSPGSTVTANNGKLSRNFYRTPYAAGVSFSITGGNNYVNHGGSMDARGGGTANVLVAMAHGWICSFVDMRNDCGCSASALGSCGNCITVLHDNGEMSRYLHLQQSSITAFGNFVGKEVFPGDILGIEGDVGNTCGSDGPPRAGTCATSVPPGTGDCFRHNHWNVIRISTGEPLMPMTCDIPGNVYSGTNYTGSGACSTATCSTNLTVTGQNLFGLGTWRVWQATNTILGSTVALSLNASAVMHAGQRVRLTPGFRAAAGAYFRAEIGNCNTTAAPPTQP